MQSSCEYLCEALQVAEEEYDVDLAVRAARLRDSR